MPVQILLFDLKSKKDGPPVGNTKVPPLDASVTCRIAIWSPGIKNEPKLQRDHIQQMGLYVDFTIQSERRKPHGNQQPGNIMGPVFQRWHLWQPVFQHLPCEVCEEKLPKQPRSVSVADRTRSFQRPTLKEPEASRVLQLLRLPQRVIVSLVPAKPAKEVQVWLKNRGRVSQDIQLIFDQHAGNLNHGKLWVKSFWIELTSESHHR